MFFTPFRLILVAAAISTLAGCAQFENSFGEVTDQFGPGTQPSALTSDANASMRSPTGRRNLAVGGVMVQLSDGSLVE